MNRIMMSVFCFFALITIALPATAKDRYRDFDGHHGYRERPYDRGRHYGHYKHKGHQYDYYGHWRSWDDWDRYTRKYPHLRRYGRYYHDGPHLMYRFCDPDAGTCIFFSIGR